MLFSIAAIWIIFSCRKAPVDEPTVYTSMATSDIENKILNFLNSFESPLKDEKMYSIDSTIWYSCAGLNFTYGIYDSSFVYVSRDTSHFSVDLNENDQVSQSDLEDLFDEMADSLEVFFDGLQDNIKHVFYCAVFEEAVHSGTLDLGMIANIGCGYNGGFYSSFGLTDWYYSIFNEGKCHGYTGTGDAAIELEYKIMHPLVLGNPDVREYAIPLDSAVDISGDEYPYQQAPRGTRAFYFSDYYPWGGPQCLDPDELNFYLTSDGIDYIINDLQPQEMEFIEIKIKGDLVYGDTRFYEAHWLTLIYGDIIRTYIPASTL